LSVFPSRLISGIGQVGKDARSFSAIRRPSTGLFAGWAGWLVAGR
jgi:hypothetical protein